MIPFLVANGLLSYRQYYCERQKGYYNFDTAVMTLAFMFLCRIKSIEQLKHHSPGEIGKLLGLDRIPEARCLRGMVKELCANNQSSQWGAFLAEDWINDEDTSIYYVDGHIQVYHGYLATLGKKHVSRQKLCLPGMMEFWINNAEGLPYFFVTGQVNEKLQQALEDEIIPHLNILNQNRKNPDELEADPLFPCYTLVFDREAYSPAFFSKIWKQHRIAIITYRKNVKDIWPTEEFTQYQVEGELGNTTMNLQEKRVEINGVALREIRKLTDDGHQTSIITTNYKLSTNMIASYMFSRWSQENFFKYMRQEYDIDRIIQYGVDELDESIMVVNREYSNLTQKLKKNREKIARRQALLYCLKEYQIRTGTYP